MAPSSRLREYQTPPPDVLARLYRRRFSTQDLDTMRRVWQVLVSDFFQARIAPGSTVIDVGAGACLFINAVRAARRIAVDANPELPLRAAEGVETLVTSDLHLGGLPDAMADCVFLSNVLEHVDDYLAALTLLSAVHRVLRSGGSAIILQPNFRLVGPRYFDFIDHRLVITEASLVEAVEVVGLAIDEMRVRFLPFTSKSRLPKTPWLVRAYLRLRPLQWLFGGQTYLRATKP